MHIPNHVLEEAKMSLEGPIVSAYLSGVCLAHGVDPANGPAYYSGPPLQAYRALRAENERAQGRVGRINPYPNPEGTMLGDLMREHLSASERMRVRTAPPHLRMGLARDLLDEKFLAE